MTKQRSKTSIAVNAVVSQPAFSAPLRRASANNKHWTWGSDNQLPYVLAVMSRNVISHRRIINDKADYISGKGFLCDENAVDLQAFIDLANGNGESLRQVFNKIAYDKVLFGNAFMEVVTDAKRSFLNVYHQDATKCRVAADSEHIVLHHNWMENSTAEQRELPIYPLFEQSEDGFHRSIIHFKDYEPMFDHYGVPTYIAGMGVSAIAYKTDRWNISRLDNSYQMSGVMMLDVETETEEELERLQKTAEERFAGKPGQILFVMKDSSDSGNDSKFIPITSDNDGDWEQLHDQVLGDIVIAHSWFRALSGMDYSTGFSTDRILMEYEVALNTVILPEQSEMLEPIKTVIADILRLDTTTLAVVNKPPVTLKPNYMRVWEARKADGLDYDPEDQTQQMYISQL
ncbi:MAG: phage portal protein [Rikenellaceae bacterium]